MAPIMEAIAALQQEIRAIQLKPGPPGPAGPPGKDGKDGDVAALLWEIEQLKGTIKRLEDSTATKHEAALLRGEVERLRQFINNLSGSIRIRVEPTAKP